MFLVFTFSSKAQEILLPQVEVTAVRTGEDPDNVPARINIINSKQIQQIPFISADEILNMLPGINESRFYGIFNKSGDISMRGLNRNVHNLILLDGMPFSLINGGAPNWNHLDPEMIDRIVVIKGPNSYLYGNNAMGGVINIITKRPQTKLSGNANAFYGTYNTMGGSLSLMGRADNIAKGLYWKMNSFCRNSDGYIMTPEELRTGSEDKTYVHEYLAAGTLGYQINKRNIIEFEYNYSHDMRGAGTKVYENDGSWNEYLTSFLRARYSGLVGNARIELNAYLKNENYLRQNEGIKKNTGKYTLYNSDNINTDKGIMLNFSENVSHLINMKHLSNTLTGGIDIKQGSTSASDIYRTSTDTISYSGKMNYYGLFLQDEQTLIKDKLRFTLAVRIDNVFFSNASFHTYSPSVSVSEFLLPYNKDYSNEQWNAFSPKVGLKYFFTKNTDIYISYSNGFRPSTLSDLCLAGDVNKGFKLPNPALKPEMLNDYEAGFSFNNDKITFEPTVFYSIGKQFQYFVATGDSVTTTSDKAKPVIRRENIDRADIYGAEIDIRYMFSEHFALLANYTFSNSKITDTGLENGKNLNGKYLIETPKHLAFAAFIWQNKIVDFTITCKYKSKQWIDDLNTVPLGDWIDFDMKLQKKINNNFTAALTIQNIVDRRYTDSKGLLNPGRYINAQLSYAFR